MVNMDLANTPTSSETSKTIPRNSSAPQSEASKMLEAALQQMDGIITSESQFLSPIFEIYHLYLIHDNYIFSTQAALIP